MRQVWYAAIAAGTLAVLAMSAPAAHAGLINVNGLLVNPSFENGNQASGCPIGWTCSSTGTPPGFSSYAPGNPTDYVPGSNGLPNGLITPDGVDAAFSPTAISGNGSLKQLTSQTISSSNIYVLDFWVGQPLGGVTFPTFRVSWLTGGTEANLCGSTGSSFASLTTLTGPNAGTHAPNDTDGPCSFSIASPGAGKWVEYELTLNNANGSTLGVFFSNLSATNNAVANIDMSASGGLITPLDVPVPEPGSMGILGASLLGLWGMRRNRRAGKEIVS